MGFMNWLKNEHTTLNPSNPQTGDGKTRRDVYDRPRNTFRTASGKALPSEPVAPVKPKKRKKSK